MKYNPKYFSDKKLRQLRPAKEAINYYISEEGIIIGMFQGSRGQFPDIDFVVKVLKPGEFEVLVPPLHMFWVVDLMIKMTAFRTEVIALIEYYLDFYDKLEPFESPGDRPGYELKTADEIIKKFSGINMDQTPSISYVAIIIELFCKNEKRNKGAYMFKDLLITLLKYAKKEVDYMTVITAAQPGFR